jgi:hypothetical protein
MYLMCTQNPHLTLSFYLHKLLKHTLKVKQTGRVSSHPFSKFLEIILKIGT